MQDGEKMSMSYHSGAAKKTHKHDGSTLVFRWFWGTLFSTSSTGANLPAQTTPTMANYVASD